MEPDTEPAAALRSFAEGRDAPGVLPWAGRLSPGERARLRADLRLLLAEPLQTGEALDWSEVLDALAEYAALAAWEGPLLPDPPEEPPPDAYRVDVRPGDLRAVERAAPAVRQAVRDLLHRFLPLHPTAGDRLGAGHLKKLANRGIWQVELPDGWRLRYLVDEADRTVYVVYLGPHPEGEAKGREEAVRAWVRSRRD